MNGAFGRDLDIRESADQTLSDLASTPAGMLVLNLQDEVFHCPSALDPGFLVAIKDLVPSLAGSPELPAEFRHGLPASWRATN